jgi:hypothetical protein
MQNMATKSESATLELVLLLQRAERLARRNKMDFVAYLISMAVLEVEGSTASEPAPTNSGEIKAMAKALRAGAHMR